MRLETFSQKQIEIFDFMADTNSYLICDGAVRSGKTVCMTVAFVLWAMSYQDGANFAICSKTVANAERNVVTPFLNIDGFKNKAFYHRAEHRLDVTINHRTNHFYVFGGKDESSYTLIQGITLAGVLLDEVALMPRSFVDQAMARTLTYGDKKIWFNCNPEGSMHWFNQEWILPADAGQKANVKHLHFLMNDNPIMGPKEIAEAESMFTGIFYQRYILGQWVMAEGLVYDMFDANTHVVDDLPTEGDYYVSSDFGIQNATVFLLWQKEQGTQRWVIKREYYYSGRDQKIQKTCAELVKGLKEMLGDIVPKQVIVDPSAAALITEMRRAGFHVLSADNDVINGISEVSTMLRQGRIAVCRCCKHTIEEFGVYAWDSKAADKGEDVPIKQQDHCMDALRYLVKTKHLVKPKLAYTSVL